MPSTVPSGHPTDKPFTSPSSWPSKVPTTDPSSLPSSMPSDQPVSRPSQMPSSKPTLILSCVDQKVIIYSENGNKEVTLCDVVQLDKASFCSMKLKEVPSYLISKEYIRAFASEFGGLNVRAIVVPNMISGETVLGSICQKTCNPSCGLPDLSEPSQKPTTEPSVCEDDHACFAVARGNKLFTICEWVSIEPIGRCKLNSKAYIPQESIPTTYDATFLHSVCKKTCGLCGQGSVLPSSSPSSSPSSKLSLHPSTSTSIAPTPCEDDTKCGIIIGKNHTIMQLCTWAKYDLTRCSQLSEDLIYPVPTHYNATYVYNICKKTCGYCDESNIPSMKPSILPSPAPSEFTTQPSNVPSMDPSQLPSSTPTICEDDTKCGIIVRDDYIMQLCEWASYNLTRCSLISKDLIYPVPTHYNATSVYNICKKTCGYCGGGPDIMLPSKLPSIEPSLFPSPTPTLCRDDDSCFAIAVGDELMTLCQWASSTPSTRCSLISKDYVSPQTMPTTYDATFVYNICKKTCGYCDGGSFDVISNVPSIAPSQLISSTLMPCEDDHLCLTIARGDKILSLCEWASATPSTRCNLRSKNYVSPDTMPTTYDATFVYNICKKTCGYCTTDGFGELKDTTSPTTTKLPAAIVTNEPTSSQSPVSGSADKSIDPTNFSTTMPKGTTSPTTTKFPTSTLTMKPTLTQLLVTGTADKFENEMTTKPIASVSENLVICKTENIALYDNTEHSIDLQEPSLENCLGGASNNMKELTDLYGSIMQDGRCAKFGAFVNNSEELKDIFNIGTNFVQDFSFAEFLLGISDNFFQGACRLKDAAFACIEDVVLPATEHFMNEVDSSGCCTGVYDSWEVRKFVSVFRELMSTVDSLMCDVRNPTGQEEPQTCGYTLIQNIVKPSIAETIQNLLPLVQIPTNQACLAFSGNEYYNTNGEASVLFPTLPLNNCSVGFDSLFSLLRATYEDILSQGLINNDFVTNMLGSEQIEDIFEEGKCLSIMDQIVGSFMAGSDNQNDGKDVNGFGRMLMSKIRKGGQLMRRLGPENDTPYENYHDSAHEENVRYSEHDTDQSFDWGSILHDLMKACIHIPTGFADACSFTK
uniref:Circumsporozoite protein n=1 Tax=Corethron hystrix TaxID=216773 RepID=A0A7S1FYB3_9STRA|mmetsp:Transcript_38770/g.90147  ORF Transcript_38770/g.90147 Transcript_38770/m.90147 type:complete len:1092 (+) Transcript_38770:2-3277(+)